MVLPDAAGALVGAGHKVYVEAGATEGLKISDEDYEKAGAKVVGLRFVGIDVMFHESVDNPLIVEAQAFTGYTAPKKFDMIEHFLKEEGLFV